MSDFTKEQKIAKDAIAVIRALQPIRKRIGNTIEITQNKKIISVPLFLNSTISTQTTSKR